MVLLSEQKDDEKYSLNLMLSGLQVKGFLVFFVVKIVS